MTGWCIKKNDEYLRFMGVLSERSPAGDKYKPTHYWEGAWNYTWIKKQQHAAIFGLERPDDVLAKMRLREPDARLVRVRSSR
jgi:hypothetical protein